MASAGWRGPATTTWRAMAAPLDLLGVNYYRRWVVAARPERPRLGGPPSPWVAAGDVEFVASDRPRTALGWEIDPSGLDELLLRLHRDYRLPPMFVTENGAAFEDGPDAHGRVRDRARIRFLDGHLRAAHRAIQGGVDLRGYRLVAAGQLRVGRRATPSGSASSTWTSRPSAGCPRTAPLVPRRDRPRRPGRPPTPQRGSSR